MLTYTVQEYNMISNAVLTASNYLDVAYDNLCLMHSNYFENKDGEAQLRLDAECDPRGIESQIYGIITALREANLEAYKKEQELLAAGGKRG